MMRRRFMQWKLHFLPLALQILLIYKICGSNSEPDFKITYDATPTTLQFSLDNDGFYIYSVTCKGLSKNNICENLDPCTMYLVAFVIRSNDGLPGEYERSMDANTTYAKPEVELIEVIPDQFSIFIKWNATNRSCVDNFEVTVISPDKEFKTEVRNKDNLIVENLNPCQMQNITIVTKDINSVVIGEPIRTSAITHYAEPENVTGITFKPVDENGVRVTWESPKNKTCVRFFFLKWTTVDCFEELSATSDQIYIDSSGETVLPGEECKWNVKNITDYNAKEYFIRNLDGCEEYYLEFLINDDVVLKSNRSMFIAPENIPRDVGFVEPKINATNVTVAWNEPQLNKKCLQKYITQMVGPLQNPSDMQYTITVETTETSAEFKDLEPCGRYNVSVRVMSLNGMEGDLVSSSIQTKEDGPTKILNVVVDSRPKELSLKWNPPMYGRLCLEGYRITGWHEGSSGSVFDKKTNETRITLQELISCEIYTVQIIPFSKTKDGAPEQIEQITSPTVAAAPSPFQSTVVNSHSLELSARVSDTDFPTNKCQTLFALFTCEANNDVPYMKAVQYVEGRLGDLSFQATMFPLSPFTSYSCKAFLYNTAGWSDFTRGVFTTLTFYPELPVNISIKSLSTTTMRFQWNVPMHSNGVVNVYILFFRRVQASYYIPPYCNSETISAQNAETAKTELEFNGLQPFTYYSVQIAAQNEYGTGDFTPPIIERTLSSISEPVYDLKVITISGPDVHSEVFKAYVVMSWQMPCSSNGEIETFELEFYGSRDGYDSVSFVRFVQPIYVSDGILGYNESDLKPEYNYDVLVSVVNKNVDLKSDIKKLKFQAPAGIPGKFEDPTAAKVDAFEASNPTSSAVIRFPAKVLNSESGTILYAALLLSQKNCNPYPELKVGALDSLNEWPDTLSWNDAYKGDECIRQYQTTPIRWQPIVPRSSTDNGSDGEVQYTIGLDSCTNATKRYCNGHLRADTEYQVVVRLFTKSSFSDAVVLEFKTDSMIKWTLILIAVVSCLLVAFIAGFLYLYISKKIIWHRESCHGIEDSSGDITSKNFTTFFPELSKKDKLQREFKELTVIATDLSFSASEANEYKNRYRDIFPYDKNRVILDVDADGNDYINASFINGYRRKKEYIATQGPKQESILDFWRMVLQHKVRIIVMVTQFREDNVIKCNDYYPWEWKDIKVEVLKSDFDDLYDRREMLVVHSKHNIRRKVIHFYFKKWPDHGIPMDPMDLVNFVNIVKMEKCPNDSPIVVHCSAGVGRTGTFIALDIIIQRLKSERKINIFETVKELRFQRMKMVQSMQQYTFLYTCAYEFIMNKRQKGANRQNHIPALGIVEKVGVADADSGECNI